MNTNKWNPKYIATGAAFLALTWILFLYIEKNLFSNTLLHIAIWSFAHVTFFTERIRFKQFVGLEILFSVFLCVVYFTGLLDVLIMPIIGFALLASILYTPLISTFMSIALVLYGTFIFGLGAHEIIAYLVATTFTPVTVTLIKQRLNFIISGLISGAIMFFIVISKDFQHIEFRHFYALLNGLVSPIITLGIMPIMESVFSVITPMRLMEISNTSKPLLKRLMLEAPGTYHHSILVGHLAETAAADIGADYLLARAGAYYHDIGKLNAPVNYFENLGGRENPHDTMTPIESANCLRDHVRIGVEILKKNHFPSAVVDIVQSHHGDSVMQYFYHKEKRNNVEADIENFRYQGPKPVTKEESIIMFADCVEAAVRANGNVSVEETIEKIFAQKIDEGQMTDSELSFKEMAIIKQSFKDVLSASGHERIKYPGDVK
ncbi:MAG: HDIG domain-containing protein [Bacillota bacterium]|nr:HDIG domain-containing protein [Bacillota bacterium]